MNFKKKIICTLGPSTLNNKNISLMKKNGVNIFRLNMSHLTIDDLKKYILLLKKNNIKNICLDTEGAQLRTTKVKKEFYLKKNYSFNIYNDNLISNKKKIYIYPKFNVNKIKKGTIIKIGFEGLVVKVLQNYKSCLLVKTINSGLVQSNKGVHIDANIKLPPLSDKDILAIKVAKKNNISIFALSFANQVSDINLIKKFIGKKDYLISKIETINSLINLKEIIKNSSAILIDRGDLSRYIPIEKIPIIQKYVSKIVKKTNKELFIATNLLESMIYKNEPTRAESNDIYTILNDGANGLVLAAETAIGNYPIEAIIFLKKCISNFRKNHNRKFTINSFL